MTLFPRVLDAAARDGPRRRARVRRRHHPRRRHPEAERGGVAAHLHARRHAGSIIDGSSRRSTPARPQLAGDALTTRQRRTRSVDLFEYQGKQFFARYGIPVSAGEAVDHGRRGGRRGRPRRLPGGRQGPGAGGRARQGGRHQARRRRRRGAHATPRTSSAWTSRATSCERVWIEQRPTSPRSTTRRSRSTGRPSSTSACCPPQGGVEIEQVAAEDPDAIAKVCTSTRSTASTEAACRAWVDGGEAQPRGHRRRGRHPDEAVPGVRRRRRRPRRDQPADPHARRARCTRSTPR